MCPWCLATLGLVVSGALYRRARDVGPENIRKKVGPKEVTTQVNENS